MVLARPKEESDIIDRYHFIVLNTYIIAGIDPHRILIAGIRLVIAVEYIVRASVRAVRPVCDKGLDHDIRVHRCLRIFGNIFCCRLDKRHDVLNSHLCILVMVNIPEGM